LIAPDQAPPRFIGSGLQDAHHECAPPTSLTDSKIVPRIPECRAYRFFKRHC
jgi:hypothetical protein